MNQLSGAEALVKLLDLAGVEHVFGLCGDTSLPLYDARFRLDHGIEHILARDERSAAYMADAYARVTGRVGVREGPSGGGAIISGGEAALIALAERLSIPVAISISGKGTIRDDHPRAVGVVGSNGGVEETRALVDGSDLLLLVGSRAGSATTERWRHPRPDSVPVIHLDIDPATPSTNYRTDAVMQEAVRLERPCLIDVASQPLHEAAAPVREWVA